MRRKGQQNYDSYQRSHILCPREAAWSSFFSEISHWILNRKSSFLYLKLWNLHSIYTFFYLSFVKTDKSFQSLKIRFIFKKLCNIKIEANSKTQLYLTLLLFIWSRMAALVRLAILRSVSSLVHRIKKKKPIISMYIKALYVHRYIWFLL